MAVATDNPSPSLRFGTVAVCVVFHEHVAELDGLMTSLREQTRPIDQLVVCVNGPDDGITARLRALSENPVIIERPDNPGFAVGVNACLERVEGTHALLLNPDVRLDPDYLATSLEVFRREADVGAVGGRLRRVREVTNEPVVDTAGFAVQPWFRIVDRGSGAPEGQSFLEREDVVGVCAAAALFDVEALARVAENGRAMDEDFVMYKEDQDLCLRLREAGYRIVYEPRATGGHARGWKPEGRRSVSLRLRRHSLKNRYLLLAKHWRWHRDWRVLPLLVGFEIFLFTSFVFREPRTMIGYVMAFRLLPRMWRKRRRLIDREKRSRKSAPLLVDAA